MQLKNLLEGIEIKSLSGPGDCEIKGLSTDSRKLSAGDLYVAVRGGDFDGHDFIADAAKKGASAIMGSAARPVPGLPYVEVEDARDALPSLANNFFGRPSEKLTVVGVTGTNGKTTTTHIIKSILEAAGKKAGLIGTIGYVIGDRTHPAPFTTPEAVEFQGLLSEMLHSGLSHVVCEVSSHALAQKRVDGTRFGAAVFTNLTRDHLDFHKTMEEYFEAKKRLFAELLSGPAVINSDDPYGKMLLGSLKGKTLAYAVDAEADITARDVSSGPGGLSFTVSICGAAGFGVESALIGDHNVYNIMAAVGAAFALGVGREALQEGVRALRLVEGRFESISLGQDFLCVVDYAHTEDALRRLILTARRMTTGKVITVFGCGGQRDRGKRPVMGALATELSDMVFITSDNPRGEEPEEIINEILTGIAKDNYRVLPDRAEAIYEAVGMAGASDAVLIAGKGHEEYQEIRGLRHPFSDRQTAREAIRKRLN